MKRPGLISLSCAATLFLAANLRAEEAKGASASPADAKPVAAPTMMKPSADELLKRYDKNGDGKLDEDERADAHEAMLKQQMTRQPNSGASVAETRQKMTEMFDKNRDGRLDEEERAEMRKYTAEHGVTYTAAELVKRFDRDGDSKLNVEETTELVKFLRERQGAMAVAAAPATKEEKERIERVAAEVARRRELREKAAGVSTGK